MSTATEALQMPLRRDAFRQVHRLLRTALCWWVLYSLFTVSSRGRCYAPEGELSATGETCETWTLGPSPFVGLAIAGLVIWTVGWIARGTQNDAQADRLLESARGRVVVMALGSLLIAQIWFWAMPAPGATDTVFFPFPFGAVTIVTS
ncbi:hypothetical protein [Microbacterium sp.]|uniref:hypothetical protein n=1 Tax=Microbacterium sp. TaxID=51671 RepID=UPI0028117F89|nr:hypothetical protein [Microbacterium sp.]